MSTPVQIFVEDVQTNTGHQVKIIKIVGQLDESNIDEHSPKIYQVIEGTDARTHYIFNMEGLEYLNSKSIGYLTDWYRKVSEKEGLVKLASAKENILDILETVGLTSIIEHHGSVDDAIRAITT